MSQKPRCLGPSWSCTSATARWRSTAAALLAIVNRGRPHTAVTDTFHSPSSTKGDDEVRARARKYIDLVRAQRIGPVHVDESHDDGDPDVCSTASYCIILQCSMITNVASWVLPLTQPCSLAFSTGVFAQDLTLIAVPSSCVG